MLAQPGPVGSETSCRPQTGASITSISHDRLIGAILRNVPGTYVRDYRGNRGWLTVCRGYKTVYDHSKDTDKFTSGVPAETLCALPRGDVQAATLYSGVEMVRPGWRVQMRQAGGLMSDGQRRRIEKELRMRVFT